MRSGGPGLADAYIAVLEQEFPGLRLIDKADDRLSRSIDWVLRVLTFGGQSAYSTRYVTTLGKRIYLPSGWADREDVDRYVTLRHEAVHLRQFQRLGWIAMSVTYLLPILPMGLALGRARLEWEAYRETICAVAEVRGLAAASDPRFHAHILEQFTSAAYGWMWPFPSQVRRWIAQVVSDLQDEADP